MNQIVKNKLTHLLLLSAACLGLAACDKQPSAPEATHSITGEAFYLVKVALPKDAVLTVRLEDVSLMDAPSVTLSEQRIALKGRQQPYDFELGYNLAELPQGHVYAVSGRIEDSSGLRFINTEQHSLLLTGEPAEVRLKLDQVTPSGPTKAMAVTPDFVCRGNEPFWNFELRKDQLMLSRLLDDIETRTYKGQFSRYSALDGGAGYQWQGLSKQGVDSTLVAEITLDYCADSMAGPEEGGDYDYRLSMGVDDEQLQGCCNLLVVESPPSAVVYQCGDQRLSAYFEDAGLRLSGLNGEGGDGNELQLPLQESASGARYALAGNEFWSKGSEATLTLAGGAVKQCQVAESIVNYQCDNEQGLTVHYQVNASGGLVRLNMADGSELRLTQQPAASGARYADDKHEFWSKGASAGLKLEDAEAINCTEQ